ncbi:MAG TPA: hypothetical protein VGL51_05570 [Solirubrobacteraceae bacterium]|jgi:hypothetical protein
MPNAFNVELSTREAPAEVQARAATALAEPARAVGLRLTKRGAGELGYTPRVQFPFLVMLYHKLSGERMTVKFEPRAEGGTRVMISGKVAGSNHMLAEDPEHWSEALGASPAA